MRQTPCIQNTAIIGVAADFLSLHVHTPQLERSSERLRPSFTLRHLIFGTSFLHHSECIIQIIHPTLSDLHLNIPV